MTSKMMRVSGVLLMIVSILGILLSLSGLVSVLWYRGRLIDHGIQVLDTSISNLEVAEKSLISVIYVLDQAQMVLDNTRDTVRELSGTLQDLDPLFESMAAVIGKDIPDVIYTTQETLETTQESARNVDNLLYALDAISFLSGVTYDPEVTLADSIQNVGASLEDLPESFSTLEEGILVTGDNIDQIGAEVSLLEASLEDVDQNFDYARLSIFRYQHELGELERDLEGIRDSLPRWVNWFSAGLAFALFWLALVQIGLFYQGWEMAHSVSDQNGGSKTGK